MSISLLFLTRVDPRSEMKDLMLRVPAKSISVGTVPIPFATQHSGGQPT